MKSNLFHFFTLLTILLSLCSCRRGSIPIDESNVIQDSGQGTGTTTWKKDKEYILEGFGGSVNLRYIVISYCGNDLQFHFYRQGPQNF